MSRYLFTSLSGHVLLFGFWLAVAPLLSKPRMSYYAVDLYTSLPGPHGTGPQPGAVAVKPAAPTPTRLPVPVAPPVEERRIPAREAIRVKSKVVKKPALSDKAKKRFDQAIRAALSAQSKSGAGAAGISAGAGGGAGGVIAEGGAAFPYPWYLKTISERLDQHWQPPQEFQTDTECVVSFVIRRDGNVSNSSIEKASGDATFDQLALRAVLYSNPMPPLPAGFPDETLRVHMKFVGKPS